MSTVELRDLEEHLRALRQEEQEIENGMSFVPESDGARTSSIGQDPEAVDSNDGNTYSSFAPSAGDVRGRKRAVFIRRSAAVGSLVLGVMVAITFVSEPLAREDALLDAAGSVPAALHEVGDTLSKQDQTAIQLRVQASEQLDHWHKKWDQERTDHLVKLLKNRAHLAHERQEERRDEEMAIQEHRQKLAQHRAERAALIAADEHKSGASQELKNSPFKKQDLAQEKNFRVGAEDKAEHARKEFLAQQHASKIAALEVKTEQQQHDDAEAAARKRYEEARKEVVHAKDALRDALALRDQESERLHADAFVTATEAQQQLQPMHEHIQALLHKTEAAREQWTAAHAQLEKIEQVGAGAVMHAAPVRASAGKVTKLTEQTGAAATAKKGAEQRLAAKASTEKMR